VCPVAIDIPGILVHLRTQVVDSHRGDTVPKAEAVAMRAASWGMGDAGRMGLGERATGLVGRLGRGRAMPGGRTALGWLPWPGSRWTSARDLPLPPTESFRQWWKRVGRDEGQR
jgi:L-lactate dehydrogenase complex protein LldF